MSDCNTSTPPAADAEPVAWLYEHPAIGRFEATERWRTDDVTEMWAETPLYTADQLQAYGDARAREALERAAKAVLGLEVPEGGLGQVKAEAWCLAIDMGAAAIRALKENPNG